mgnify:CR=1 FL=1
MYKLCNLCLIRMNLILGRYQRYEAAKERAEEAEHRKEEKRVRRRLQEEEPENVRQREVERMYRASKILERMVNQNNLNDISVGEKKHLLSSSIDDLYITYVLDFRFYEDQSDTYKELEGTLLPLWTFSYKDKEANHKYENTALCWNARYHDLFAAGYGSCE